MAKGSGSDFFTKLLYKCGEEKGDVEVGPEYASGSQLPSHSDVNNCVLTGKRIQVQNLGEN